MGGAWARHDMCESAFIVWSYLSECLLSNTRNGFIRRLEAEA